MEPGRLPSCRTYPVLPHIRLDVFQYLQIRGILGTAPDDIADCALQDLQLDGASIWRPSILTCFPPSSAFHPHLLSTLICFPPSSAFHPRLPSTLVCLPPSSAFHPPSSAFHPPSSAFHPPSSAFHPPSSAFHPPSSAFHPPSSAFHPPSSAFHPRLPSLIVFWSFLQPCTCGPSSSVSSDFFCSFASRALVLSVPSLAGCHVESSRSPFLLSHRALLRLTPRPFVLRSVLDVLLSCISPAPST
ncbi:unnamed protein product [Closterium sp. NIES-53]